MHLEVESDLCCQRAGRNVVRSAKRRREVVKRNPVRQIDRAELHAPLVSIAMENVVVTNGEIEQIAGRDARRIVIGVLRPGRRNRNQGRTVL